MLPSTRRRLALAITLVGAAVLSGCIVVPRDPWHGGRGRYAVEAQVVLPPAVVVVPGRGDGRDRDGRDGGYGRGRH